MQEKNPEMEYGWINERNTVKRRRRRRKNVREMHLPQMQGGVSLIFGKYVRNVISSSHQPFSIVALHHGKAQNACFFFGEYRYGFIDFENAMLTLSQSMQRHSLALAFDMTG
jgi:hypothetical protein